MKKFFLILIMLLLTGCGTDSAEELTDLQQRNNAFVGEWPLLGPGHGTEGNAWQLENCDACHLLSGLHQQQSNIQQIVRDKGYATCVGCHGDNGTELNRPCLICHNTTDMPQATHTTGELNHNFKNGQDPLSDQDCLNCHLASDMNGQFSIQIDLTRYKDEQGRHQPYEDRAEFCLRCHNQDHQQVGFEITDKDYQDPLVAMRTNYQSIDWHGDLDGSGERTFAGLRPGYTYPQRLDCNDCHNMHGTHNQKLLIGSSRQGANKLLPVGAIAGQPFTVTVKDGDSSQLCVLCHNMTQPLDDAEEDTGNSLSGVHLTGRECSSCHRHGMATQVGL